MYEIYSTLKEEGEEVSRYKMRYISGGGTEYDGGIWEVKKTAKTITFKCIKKSFYEPNILFMRIKLKKERSHCLRDWNDGTYTVYPFQSGVPHIFEPETPHAKA